MGKVYLKPNCEIVTLPSGKLCTTVGSVKVSNENADQGGWSKKFWGNSVFGDEAAEDDDVLE